MNYEKVVKKQNSVPYKIYDVDNYAIDKSQFDSFLKSGAKEFTTTKKLISELQQQKHYHFRVLKETQYIFFGDIDHYDNGIDKFRSLLQSYMKEYYDLEFTDEEFKYTENDKNNNSYHYSIPKWNLSTEKLKEILTNFLTINKKEFTKTIGKKQSVCVDTTIYASGSGHWFRCPNQFKGNESVGIHVIKHGNMEDFIIDYIPTFSIDINNVKTLIPIIEKNKKEKKIIVKGKKPIIEIDEDSIEDIKDVKDDIDIVDDITIGNKNDLVIANKQTNRHNDMILSTTLSQTTLYKKMFDECYNKDRFEVYKYWISVGMAIKNSFQNEEEAIDLFNYFSSKGSNYAGYEKTILKYKTFVEKNNSNGYTIATIHYYAIEDNKPKFIEIISKNSFELEHTDICKYLKIIAGYKFVYKLTGENQYKLYCYNGKYWQTDDTLIKMCISNELYEFLKTILIEVYWKSNEFQSIKKKLDRLKNLAFKKDIIETYKEYGINNDIKFDDKWWLLGFNNLVYDMESDNFREYKYDDYVSMTCGYDWREPTPEELQTMNDLIKSIMPDEEDRNLYLQILCTALEGCCLERFIIFNGSGGNGKGMIDDLMLLALGEYALLGNNGILFETSKTGSNPEKAKIHKKRLVLFREPPEKNKFENSIIKELTGGGTFSARNLYEKDTEKELNLTMIVECNKRPLFAEEPTDAEIRRLIDLQFKSTFTSDTTLVDPSRKIFLANSVYKTKDFQHKHKFALIRILLDEHKKYRVNNRCLHIPKNTSDRTQSYLEMSCNIVQWFKENYEYTGNTDNVQKVKDIFEHFSNSNYYANLSKLEKRKYNKSYFSEYFETNIFFRKYYHERSNNIRNIIKGWKPKELDI